MVAFTVVFIGPADLSKPGSCRRSKVQGVTTMMMSQLGRMILDSSGVSSDEAGSKPDEEGRYAPIHELLGELADRVRSEPSSGGGRRPGDPYSSR